MANGTVTSSTEYVLKSSWILSTGSKTHVCNKTMKHRFIKEKEGNGGTIISGSGIIPVEAYGRIDITIKGENSKTMTMTLLNVNYVSEFKVNMVSAIILHEKGVDFDTRDARLHRNGSTFGYAELKHGHWVMEYNPMNPTSDTPETNQASFFTATSSIQTPSHYPPLTDLARCHEIEIAYHSICKGPKNPDVDEWLGERTRVHHIVKEFDIAETKGTRPANDFLTAVWNTDADFTKRHLFSGNPIEVMDIDDLVRRFRDMLSLKGSIESDDYVLCLKGSFESDD